MQGRSVDRRRDRRWVLWVCLLGVGMLLVGGCASGKGARREDSAALQAQRMAIANEPTGPWFVGRRYFTEGTRFWGYLRRPRQGWDQSKLVIFNEREALQPDRLPEEGVGGPIHGHDHNFEYRIWGYYSGESVYDPNSNAVIPEFVIQRHELISRDPGFLFSPGDRYDSKRLPSRWQ